MVLMDVHLPGIKQVKQIREFDSYSIITITAISLDEKNDIYIIGMNDVVTKPFAPEVYTVIANNLS
jgi:DNA-binding response OmpR family regulator